MRTVLIDPENINALDWSWVDVQPNEWINIYVSVSRNIGLFIPSSPTSIPAMAGDWNKGKGSKVRQNNELLYYVL